MSLIDLKKDELLEAAAYYDVEVQATDNKATIVEALEEAGVTEELWEADKPREAEDEPAADEPEADEDEDLVLVKFIGHNRSYTVGKTTFTPKLKPFGLLTRSEYESHSADKFREATADEATEFYGQ